MAKGDAVGDLQSVNADAVLTIQPGAGIEWIIHNIYHEDSVEIYLVESTNELLFNSDAAKGSLSAFFFHLTNSHYLKAKNKAGSAKLIGYDGIVSKQ